MADAVLFSVAAYAPGKALLAGNLKEQIVILPFNKNVYDARFSGMFGIVGTTVEVGPPETAVSRRVRLYRRDGGCLCVRELVSDPADGTYRFEGISYGPWTVIAYDHTDTYNAAVADNKFGSPLYGR